jgi:hypothetical protein
MSGHRATPGSAADGGPAPGVAAGRDADPRPHPLADPRALQILIAEHGSLSATRSMTWNEVFSRVSIFFTTLSAAAVALALIGQATAFGQGFLAFALIILPVVLFLGVATFVRLSQANNEDVVWIVGLNRIRSGYAELVPGIENMFITGHTGDARGINRTFGFDPSGMSTPNSILHGLVTAPAIVGVVDSVLAGAIAGLVVTLVSESVTVATVVGLIAMAAGLVVVMAYGRRNYFAGLGRLERLHRENREWLTRLRRTEDPETSSADS